MRHKALSDEDRILWSQVARTARPLKGRAPPATPEPLQAPTMVEAALPSLDRVPAPVRQTKPAPVATIDRPTLDRLAKGRVPIEGRVDLHGLKQDEAYALLHAFLHRAHAGGMRYVLIITGKGSSSGGDGVLKRAVPGWLATPSFRTVVASHDHAARNHGGSGALYVRLRRNRL